MKSYFTHSPEQTMQLAISLGRDLPVNSVIALFGDLGAGKTTFIKGLVVGAIDYDPGAVQSPTFAYLNIYTGKKTVYHFDLYRLQGIDQFLSMGFDEYFDADGLCCIEWAERISTILPSGVIRIEIKHKELNSREIIIGI